MKTLWLERDSDGAFYLKGDRRGMSVRLFRDGDDAQVDARADFREARGDKPLHDGPKWTLLRGREVRAVGGFWREPGTLEWRGWGYAADLGPREWAFVATVAEHLVLRLKRIAPRSTVYAIPAPTPQADALLAHMGFLPVAGADDGAWAYAFEEAA
jgi:hypothetical protein